jgi:hypothetical protein
LRSLGDLLVAELSHIEKAPTGLAAPGPPPRVANPRPVKLVAGKPILERVIVGRCGDFAAARCANAARKAEAERVIVCPTARRGRPKVHALRRAHAGAPHGAHSVLNGCALPSSPSSQPVV